MRDLFKNPFLILGASSDAEWSDIKSDASRELMQLQLSGESGSARKRDIEIALETLQDNVSRFHWGLLWMELTPSELKKAHDHTVLTFVRDDSSHDIYKSYKQVFEAPSTVTRVHNLGVISLLEAAVQSSQLDYEGQNVDEKVHQCVQLWRRTFSQLSYALNSDEFWMRRRILARSIDDPRLNDNCITQIRTALPREILHLCSEFIAGLMLEREIQQARSCIEAIQESGFPQEAIASSLSEACRPLTDRVNGNINQLKERLGELDETDDEQSYVSLMWEFQVTIVPDLDVMVSLGDLPSSVMLICRDACAAFLRELSVDSFNATENMAFSKGVVALAFRYAVAETLRSQLLADGQSTDRIELLKKLRYAMEIGDHEDALNVLDQYLALDHTDPDSDLFELRMKLQSSMATRLYNEAISISDSQPASAALMLRQALKIEPYPSEQSIIRHALAGLMTDSWDL